MTQHAIRHLFSCDWLAGCVEPGFVRAKIFYLFLVRRNAIDFVAPPVPEVVGWLRVRERRVRHYS
jgi:hypothetical protein